MEYREVKLKIYIKIHISSVLTAVDLFSKMVSTILVTGKF